MEDVSVMPEDLWRYIADICEIDSCEEIFEDRDSEDCSGVGWVDKCDSSFFLNFFVIHLIFCFFFDFFVFLGTKLVDFIYRMIINNKRPNFFS